MYIDSTYFLVIIGAIISAIASWNVKRTYNKYSRSYSVRGITAEECAMQIMHDAGIYDVRIERIGGSLTDHYSPNEKVLRLSDTVYGSRSIAAIGVAAHECGHAIQHQVDYAPLHLRSAAVPVANIGSRLSWPVILIGMAFGLPQIAKVGVILFVFVVAFQLITLPVEFDASRRALKVLESRHILEDSEMSGAARVLTAAALTYVAALFAAVLQLLRLIMITQNGNRRRR